MNAILFGGLDDTDAVRKVAAEHDVVINTADARHSKAADAIINGLADRQKSTGKATHLVHVRWNPTPNLFAMA